MSEIAHLLARADQLSNAGHPTQAGALYREALTLDPSSVPARLGLGEVLLVTGDLKAAQELGQSALDLDPQDATAVRLLCHVALESGDTKRALTLAEEMSRLAPESWEGMAQQATALSMMGHRHRQKAQKLAREIVTAAPDDPDAHDLLGIVMGNTGDEESSVQAHRRAVAMDPTDTRLRVNLAAAEANQSDFRTASHLLTDAAAEHPDDPGVHRMLGAARNRARLLIGIPFCFVSLRIARQTDRVDWPALLAIWIVCGVAALGLLHLLINRHLPTHLTWHGKLTAWLRDRLPGWGS